MEQSNIRHPARKGAGPGVARAGGTPPDLIVPPSPAPEGKGGSSLDHRIEAPRQVDPEAARNLIYAASAANRTALAVRRKLGELDRAGLLDLDDECDETRSANAIQDALLGSRWVLRSLAEFLDCQTCGRPPRTSPDTPFTVSAEGGAA